jgi:sugar phosphate isomerase/epimerase
MGIRVCLCGWTPKRKTRWQTKPVHWSCLCLPGDSNDTFEFWRRKIEFGVCGDIGMAATAAQVDYDYAEWSVPALLKPRESEDAFRASLDALHTARLPYPVLNCFVPGDLKITGPDVDTAALKDYVSISMVRAEAANVEVIVFGSGGARRVPDGFDRRVAYDQLVAFCRMVGPLAHDHGVTVVVEPLNRLECNILNTVDECAALVHKVGHPSIRLLVDAYHLLLDGDSCESIATHGKLLAHVHIATIPNRLAPAAEDCDLSAFFDALAKARYTGRISIESNIPNPQVELPAALALMRKLSSGT